MWWVIAALVFLMLLAWGTRSAGLMATAAGQEPQSVYIVSPWDGTFYSGEYYGASPYVQPGSEVEPETRICTIEAMRPFTLTAGVRGKVVEILVADGQMVTAGQALMKIEPKQPPVPQPGLEPPRG
jgi:biotin carboxyl carrier protein